MLWMKLILNYKSVACDETKLPYEKKNVSRNSLWPFYQEIYIRRHQQQGQNEDSVHHLGFVHMFSLG